ncbi:hypothetical protein Ahy_A03g010916 isoform B [Arachis hypogaea]|uniref:Uncharacterized protein n=1 Tax=Arachis hypogaea TaxID=3818 RepID=A0A445DNY5_ARAHY|nr:hypothetical protein Ahy_A03g010916 isoform B [Arachis hypogaea]
MQVNDPKVRNLLLGGQRIIWRFPSSIKASKLPKYEFTPTKGSLTSGKQNSHQIDTPAQPQTQVDMQSYTQHCGCCGQLFLVNLETMSWLTTYYG